jgi:hypothetical protein
VAPGEVVMHPWNLIEVLGVLGFLCAVLSGVVFLGYVAWDYAIEFREARRYERVQDEIAKGQ